MSDSASHGVSHEKSHTERLSVGLTTRRCGFGHASCISFAERSENIRGKKPRIGRFTRPRRVSGIRGGTILRFQAEPSATQTAVGETNNQLQAWLSGLRFSSWKEISASLCGL